LQNLDQKEGYYDVLIGIFTFTVLNELVTINVLVDIFGHRAFESEFLKDERILEFVYFSEAGEVVPRSSVAAQFILRRVSDPNITVDVIIKIAQRLDELRQLSGLRQQYSSALHGLVQFGQLQAILPYRNDREQESVIFRYYEAIKSLNYCSGDPQFWLQYAIAATIFDKLERAGKYFATSYALANKDPNYDYSKIDNFAAFYKIKLACQKSSIEHAMNIFREARDIILRQMQSGRVHYPYRVATSFGDFFDHFSRTLSVSELQEVIDAAQFVRRKIGGVPPELMVNANVRRCKAAMERICNQGLDLQTRKMNLAKIGKKPN
ncbi:MAG: hypothetical protein MUD10_05085, partial [Candidatus Pacebacteria bacterium]|jgi:hypothetical protein|nr:hypothetical protein [Candidatus Paceibacterota bacterium]